MNRYEWSKTLSVGKRHTIDRLEILIIHLIRVKDIEKS